MSRVQDLPGEGDHRRLQGRAAATRGAACKARAIAKFVLAGAVAGALAGCTWSWAPEEPLPPPAPAPASAPPASPAPPPPAPQELATRQRILETALGQLGRPYRYGGGDGEGFDCSGLVQHVYADSGVALPRTAAEQARAGREIGLAEAQPGDLVIFRIDGRKHVTIYVGDGRVVHAPAAGKDVRLARLHTPYWRERFHSAVRVLP